MKRTCEKEIKFLGSWIKWVNKPLIHTIQQKIDSHGHSWEKVNQYRQTLKSAADIWDSNLLSYVGSAWKCNVLTEKMAKHGSAIMG